MRKIRISTNYFVAGVIVLNDRVIRTAPILEWSLGYPVDKLLNWAMKKNAKIEELDNAIQCMEERK